MLRAMTTGVSCSFAQARTALIVRSRPVVTTTFDGSSRAVTAAMASVSQRAPAFHSSDGVRNFRSRWAPIPVVSSAASRSSSRQTPGARSCSSGQGRSTIRQVSSPVPPSASWDTTKVPSAQRRTSNSQ